MTEAELSAVRAAYAKHVMLGSQSDDSRLALALAELRREDFLGPGPWGVSVTAETYRCTPDADPVHVYQDRVIALRSDKELNNGLPSSLMFLISLGRIAEGEHAVHIGAGVGYYTAFLARLVGETGRVTAIEYEPDLAARAQANLAAFPQVKAFQGDGSTAQLDPADVILLTAGAAQPASIWLDALNEGGRLILPLTYVYRSRTGLNWSRGAYFLIERNGADYSATWKAPTSIYPCVGMQSAAATASLAAAFRAGGAEKVRRLYRSDDVPVEQCWARGPGWALAYR